MERLPSLFCYVTALSTIPLKCGFVGRSNRRINLNVVLRIG